MNLSSTQRPCRIDSHSTHNISWNISSGPKKCLLMISNLAKLKNNLSMNIFENRDLPNTDEFYRFIPVYQRNCEDSLLLVKYFEKL